MRRGCALAVALIAWTQASVHAQDHARTGALDTSHHATLPSALGGDGPRFALYLRADGALGEAGRTAIAAALAALARLPGAAVEIYVEPRDRDAPALASVLSELTGEPERRTLLGAILDQDLPRWADGATLVRLARQAGLSWRGQRAGRAAAAPNPGAGRGLLRRPGGLRAATQSFFALAEPDAKKLSSMDLDALVTREVWPEPSDASAHSTVEAVLGDPLAGHLVLIRLAAPLGREQRALFGSLRALLDEGRIRLRIELDEDLAARAAPAEVVVNLGLSEGTQAQRLQLLSLLLEEPPGRELSDIHSVWLLQAVGIDPVPLVLRNTPPTPPPPAVHLPALTVDGLELPVSAFPDLERRLRPPSLRQRLGARAP